MPHAKRPNEVRGDLEARLKTAYKGKITLVNVDMYYFRQYYDIFGPEQESTALNELGALLSSQEGINYCTLFDHHGDDVGSKVYRNHFLLASFADIDPEKLGQDIATAVNAMEISLYDPHDAVLKPTNRKSDFDGSPIVVDPKKLAVHMGIASYEGKDPDVAKLIVASMEAEEKSKASKIYSVKL